MFRQDAGALHAGHRQATLRVALQAVTTVMVAVVAVMVVVVVVNGGVDGGDGTHRGDF